MRVAMLGGSGRTGRLVVQELVRRGHEVMALVRDASGDGFGPGVTEVVGPIRDVDALRGLVTGADAVVSALGPRRGDRTLHRDVAPLLVEAMRQAHMTRFVGISGAGMDVAGDAKSGRDRVVSALMQRLGGAMVADKAGEQLVWASSGLDWTLVRAPRLTGAPATGRVEHHAHSSPRRTSIGRADLAVFVVDCVEHGGYVRRAPLVAGAV